MSSVKQEYGRSFPKEHKFMRSILHLQLLLGTFLFLLALGYSQNVTEQARTVGTNQGNGGLECSFANGTKTSVVFPDKEASPSTNELARLDIRPMCKGAIKISLLPNSPEDYLDFNRLRTYCINLVLSIPHVDMCVKAYSTLTLSITVNMTKHTGKCKGPRLDIIGNNFLEKIILGENVKLVDENWVRIRGNRYLQEQSLTLFRGHGDIQVQNDIRNSPQLCITNRTALYEKFPGIQISNNKIDCTNQCKGGTVDEEFLARTNSCDTIVGDVIVENKSEMPKNIDKLKKIRYIDGRLVMKGNKGLGEFDALENVEVIGRPTMGNPSIEISNNTGLTSVSLPKLKTIPQTGQDVKVKIVGNEKLKLPPNEVQRFEAAAGGSQYVVIENKASEDRDHWWLLVVLIVLLLVLLLLCLIVAAMVSLLRSGQKLPPKLSKKSQDVLLEMCKEIMEKNPMVWQIQDRDLLWRYGKNDPKREGVESLTAKHHAYLHGHAAPLIPNGKLSDKDRRYVGLLQARIEKLLVHPVVLAFAMKESIEDVLPAIPQRTGIAHAFEGGFKFRLKHTNSIGDRTLEYVYQVSLVQGNKKVNKKWRVVLYVWEPLRLPVEFDELFRHVKMFTDKKLICLSDRRKEVFSMLHLIYTYVQVLQETIKVEDAFRLHTETCNGAPLDKFEMLYVMAFILEWARQTRTIPSELEEKHLDWCHTYARMSAFSREHHSVMVIKPDHIYHENEPRREVLTDEVQKAGNPAGARFSERPQTAMKDTVRLITPAESKARTRTVSVAKTENTDEPSSSTRGQDKQKHRAADSDRLHTDALKKHTKSLTPAKSVSTNSTPTAAYSCSDSTNPYLYSRKLIQHQYSSSSSACTLDGVWSANCKHWRTMFVVLLANSSRSESDLSDIKNFINGVTQYCDSTSTLQLFAQGLTSYNFECPMTRYDSSMSRSLMDKLTLEATVVPDDRFPGEVLAALLEQVYICTVNNQLASGEAGVVYVLTNVDCDELCETEDLRQNTGPVTQLLILLGFIVQYMFLETDVTKIACASSLFSECSRYNATQCAVGLYGNRSRTLSDSVQYMLTCPRTEAQSSGNMTTIELVITIAVPCFCLTVICSVCTVYCYKRAKFRAKVWGLFKQKHSEHGHPLSHSTPDNEHSFHPVSLAMANHYMDIKTLSELNRQDEWEVPLEDIIIDDNHLLGNGAFAVVHKATVKGKIPLMKVNPHLNFVNDHSGTYEAAVKRLPCHAVEQNRVDFFHEINFMKNLGYHTHVISMLGCVSCTVSPMILVEYCEHGDLLHFVRKQRGRLLTHDNEDSSDASVDICVRIKDLVSIAWQVSDGLTYLSSKNFIHRDVAARNVLLTKHLVAKVSDFGLGRYADSALYTARGGRLPFKSMSLEALKYYEFSEKSDVWAFAILLFEMFSFGDVPYAAIQPADMISHVEQGNRPEQPERCPDEIFALMTKCWRSEPKDRPTFSEIRSELTILLNTDDESYGYLSLGNESRYCNIRETAGVSVSGSDQIHQASEQVQMGDPIEDDTVQGTSNDDTFHISNPLALDDAPPIVAEEEKSHPIGSKDSAHIITNDMDTSLQEHPQIRHKSYASC
ncbi:hypothetical protein Q1695_008385 [Nippostrongylus brasiliensis]|nr:hypothetical protein Q1695_008385 [Nippostrongylus brasiliensis]